MAAMATPRKTVSIHDYPEHLNPFREDDNHNKIRFWTLGRKLSRSNSITFNGIKDFKNSWALRSFMKKGKKEKSSKENQPSQANGETSPIVYRRALQYSSASSTGGLGTRNTVPASSPDRYVYGGSVTPLPRSRFQERLRSTSQHEVESLCATPRMARSDVTGSRLSVESTNPFDEYPVPPVRASRRKKKKAPLPPGNPNISVSSTNSDVQICEIDESNNNNNTEVDIDIDKMDYTVELQIIEDEDLTATKIPDNHRRPSNVEIVDVTPSASEKTKDVMETPKEEKSNTETTEPNTVRTSGSEDDILSKGSFPKIDIVKYRRNSSLNEDDIKLRRGNLEDFHSLSNKRSKSCTNALDTTYTEFDINLNDNHGTDQNGNEEPQKLICKVYDGVSRKQSTDNSISSTEKEFNEIDRATRELEREISKLNCALSEDGAIGPRLSVSEIKRRFDNSEASPNPIPKPRRSHYGDSISPVNGNHT